MTSHPINNLAARLQRCRRAAAGIAIALACIACSTGPRPDEATPSSDPAPLAVTDLSEPSHPAKIIRVGVLAFNNAALVYQRYHPLIDYLAEETGYSFILVPLTPTGQFEEVVAHDLHLVISNPIAAVQLQRLYGATFIATQTRPETGAEFSGQIVVVQDSPIKALEDLRGKRAACVNFQTAAAGCAFQSYHLLQQGIDPHRDFDSFIELSSQNNMVLGVLNGTLDAGFIRTGQLEQMEANGLIDSTSELRVLEPKKSDFPYSHTTALYPEWPVAVLHRTDPDLVSTIEGSLLKLPLEHPALVSAQLTGFVPAKDYTPIEELIEQLRLTSWNAD